MSIRGHFTILFNGIAILIVLIISILFYKEFQQSLDERILLQLSSIKNLKRNHIEKYITSSWNDFNSKKEVEVLKMLIDGLTTKEIAQKLYIISRTVETHRSNMLKKLDVKNIAELINKSKTLGII